MDKILNKRTAYLVGAIFVLLLVYGLGLNISRSGKVNTNIVVISQDSEVTINDKRINTGTQYIKPGEYTFKATRSGFSEDKIVVNVSDKQTTVELLPQPNSDEAEAYINSDPKIQQQREIIGGRRANNNGLAREDQTPLIALLPYTDIMGPFTLDYGPSTDRRNGVFIEVSDSSPDGRANAVKWMKERGQDPTDTEVRYNDFVNPLVTYKKAGEDE